VDIRADIYSLGCALHFLLTGQPLFAAATLMHKLMQHQESPPPSLKVKRPDVPDELDALVQKMLAKSPEDRPQIPLLVINPLRKFCLAGTPAGGTLRPVVVGAGVGLRPGSSASLPTPSSNNLPRPGTAPGTAINLPRPQTHTGLDRPGTGTNLPRPGTNGNGRH